MPELLGMPCMPVKPRMPEMTVMPRIHGKPGMT